MLLAIPSRARADQINHTYDNLPKALKKATVFFVPKSEVLDYARRFGITVIGINENGIGPTRQRIMKYAYHTGHTKVCMMDDDLSFFERRKDDPTKLLKASSASIAKMFSTIDRMLNRYAHVGVAAREGANRCIDEFIFNNRMLRVLAYRVDMLHNLKVQHDRLPVMEDFDVTLQLLRRGLPNAILNHWAQDQGTSNAAGGCSTYRTQELQADGANGLKALHENFVTVVTKTTKGAWGGGDRTDVRVAWKKAYESAC
jgi:hypothetical protein